MTDCVEVVIVDDHKSYRDTLASIISRHNIEVVGSLGSGTELLDFLKRRHVDVILLDIEMPEMNGSETLNKLRALYPNARTIIISQFDDAVLIRDFLNRGACGFIPKNSEVTTIAKAIHEVKRKGFFRDNLKELEERKSKSKRSYYKVIFSKREREIIHLLCKGKQITEISAALCIAEKTVEANITEIYRKANVTNRSEFLIYAIQEGLNYLSIT